MCVRVWEINAKKLRKISLFVLIILTLDEHNDLRKKNTLARTNKLFQKQHWDYSNKNILTGANELF